MSSRASSKSFKHVAGGQVFDTPSRLLASREVSQLRIRVPVESARNGDERRSSTAGSANLRIVPLSLLSCLPNFQFAICNGVPVLCQLDFHRSNRLRRVPRFLKSITSASLPCRASAGICVCHQLQRVAPAAERPAKLNCNPLQNEIISFETHAILRMPRPQPAQADRKGGIEVARSCLDQKICDRDPENCCHPLGFNSTLVVQGCQKISLRHEHQMPEMRSPYNDVRLQMSKMKSGRCPTGR